MIIAFDFFDFETGFTISDQNFPVIHPTSSIYDLSKSNNNNDDKVLLYKALYLLMCVGRQIVLRLHFCEYMMYSHVQHQQ